MIFDAPAPRWFSIDADRPFVDDLARGLQDTLAPQGPAALSDALVLVPTRRAAGALAEAFVAAAGSGALLLPQIRAVGELDEGEPPFEPGSIALDLPAAIDSRRRRFELARLVKAREDVLGRRLDATGALDWADALAGFLDACRLEEVDPAGRVDGLVDGDQAVHWQRSAELLKVVAEDWPARLAALGLVDASERQVRLLRALAAQWTADPPAGPLIAAGSTGSAPATADLLIAIARAPRGAVVLPGLDRDLSDEAWALIAGEDGEQHPQGSLKRLLERAGVARADVAGWPGGTTARGCGWARRRLLNEALRPAEATADWLETVAHLQAEGLRTGADPLTLGLEGVSLVEARNEEEAAAVAAVLLREALEVPGRTAALITPDRDLARRVSARLTRWDVRVDDSAGAPLTAFPIGVLASLTADLAADPAEPVALLGVLKHPLVRLGLEDDVRSDGASALETRALRGARVSDWAGLSGRVGPTALEGRAQETADAFDRRVARDRAESARSTLVADPLHSALTHLAHAFAAGPVGVAAAARAHVVCLETLACDASGDLGALWAGPDGEGAAELFSGLIADGAALPPVDADGYAALLRKLASGETVRAGGATHPRLRILGAIEARLVRADRVLLAGLEEGVWPRPPPIDPLLSRPMRARLGLPPPERRVGLSAYDFVQAACAPEVTLLRTARRGGAPTVASRWLWRLQTLARGAGRPLVPSTTPLAWAAALDAPGPFSPAVRPAPRPPFAARPRGLSVTRIETWVRNPYETYAREILRLRPLDPADAQLQATTRGTAVHEALERFAERFDGYPPAERAAAFAGLLDDSLQRAGLGEPAVVRERALSRNSGEWFAGWEAKRRDGAVLHIERSGALTLRVDGRPFRITAKADRIEVRPDGADILDFKTGSPPSKRQAAAGFAPQLTLTAAILCAGGFPDIPAVEPRRLMYLKVTLRKPPAVETVHFHAGESAEEADRAIAGLVQLVRSFDDEIRPYQPWVAPHMRKYDSAYDHLARWWEWAVLGDGEDDIPG